MVPLNVEFVIGVAVGVCTKLDDAVWSAFICV